MSDSGHGDKKRDEAESRSPDAKTVRIDAAQEIAAAWWRRRASGERVSEAEIIAAYPQLMPELAEHLRFLRLMQPQPKSETLGSSILHEVSPSPPESLRNLRSPRTRQSAEELPSDKLGQSSLSKNSQLKRESSVGTRASSRGAIRRSFDSTLTSGRVLADRFRIVMKLGEGGLGDVYLAYDQSLRKEVAVKVIRDHQMKLGSERLIEEVRLAQRVSHINVCRIHDLVLDANPPLLTMEYIDGEDLDKTLLRIGHFPPSRALQISIELCRGLAAAHQQGLIHRDLKPTNVMLDSAGLIRITDFGLARSTLNGDADEVAGTQYYMAPEQRRGDGTTVQSDIYSLGIVLYEIHTGVHPASCSIQEITPPSHCVPNIDSNVDATILQCLEEDPSKRPPSALAVLAQLTGKPHHARPSASASSGPSTDRTNAATRSRHLATRVRWLAILFTIGLTATFLSASKYQMLQFVEFGLDSPDAYRDHATDLIRELGHPLQRRRDKNAAGFRYVSRFRNEPAFANRAISFWYRQSGTPMHATNLEVGRDQRSVGVLPHIPEWNQADMVGIELAPNGALREYRCTESNSATGGESKQLSVLFAAAGLEVDSYADAGPIAGNIKTMFGPLGNGTLYQPKPATSKHGSPGTVPTSSPDVFVKTDEGHVVRFRPLYEPIKTKPGSRLGDKFNDALFVTMLLTGFAGCWLARRNVKLGRADLRGAGVSAAIVFGALLVSLLLSAKHQVELVLEVQTLQLGMCNALFWAAVQGVLYLALEPLVQRDHPELLRDWSLFARGEFSRPAVVLSVLTGATLAAISSPLIAGGQAYARLALDMPTRYGIPPGDEYALMSAWSMLRIISNSISDAMYFGLTVLMLPMLLKKVFGNFRIACVVAWLINSTFYGLYFGGGIEPLSDRLWFFAYMSLWAALHLFIALRIGLLSMIVFVLFANTIYDTPFSMSRWYFDSALLSFGLMTGVIWAYAIWFLLQRQGGIAPKSRIRLARSLVNGG